MARDVIARSGECGSGEALLRPVILGGRLIEPLPTLEQARRRAAESIAKLPATLRQLEEAEPWPVIYSRELRELIDRTRAQLAGMKTVFSTSIRSSIFSTLPAPSMCPAPSA